MDYEYSDLVAQAKSWANEMVDSAWAAETELNNLLDYDARTPDALFSESSSRPLIVAFLGGTGVGKSTLLNRLARKEIARTGVVRPTSKEVTLFHHNSVKVSHLPTRLPVDKIKITEHNEENNKHIIWIDMPDFDSTEQSNQQLVLEWLPHIDVLIYVVSPERYRDNKAWKILLSEGGKHAWIFVLNQSDRGQAEQYQDFVKQLEQAGFSNPLVYQSCCSPDRMNTSIDEFSLLQKTLQNLATDNTIKQLELRGLQVRKTELSKVLQTSSELLGPATVTSELMTFWQSQWRDLERLIIEASMLPIQQMAEYYALHTSDLANKKTEPYLHHRVWDKWAQARFNDTLDGLILRADELQMPAMPLKLLLLPVRESSEQVVEEQTLLSVRKALIKPGNILQRSMIKIAQFAEVVLPIAAMGWVGYQVFIEFYESSLDAIPHYVGTDFAINSVMLIAIAWLFPYFLQKKLKPSIEKAALKGLNQGFVSALQTLGIEVQEGIKVNAQAQELLRVTAQSMITKCTVDTEKGTEMPVNTSLERMLL